MGRRLLLAIIRNYAIIFFISCKCIYNVMMSEPWSSVRDTKSTGVIFAGEDFFYMVDLTPRNSNQIYFKSHLVLEKQK